MHPEVEREAMELRAHAGPVQCSVCPFLQILPLILISVEAEGTLGPVLLLSSE